MKYQARIIDAERNEISPVSVEGKSPLSASISLFNAYPSAKRIDVIDDKGGVWASFPNGTAEHPMWGTWAPGDEAYFV